MVHWNADSIEGQNKYTQNFNYEISSNDRHFDDQEGDGTETSRCIVEKYAVRVESD
jgi:hypothetical protein